MRGLPDRGRRVWWITAVLAIAIVAGAGGVLRWWTGHGVAGPVSEGIAAYARGDWERSALLARRRLAHVPDDQDALQLAARTMSRLERNKAAIATYSRLELKRMAAEDHFLLGRALSRTGKDDLALKSLEASRDADPDRLETLDELAQVYSRKDRPAAAEALAGRLLREPGREAQAQLMLGTFRAAQHDPAGAARALQRAFELDPDGKAASPHRAGSLRLLLVRCLLQAARPAEARRVLRAIPGSESEPESAWLLSRSFIQERDWAKAAEALRAAGSYRGDHPLEPEPAPYVGEARCAGCHRSAYEALLTSRHSKTFARAYDAQSVPWPDPSPLPDPGDPRVSHRYERRDDGIHVETTVGDQVFRAVARYAFGFPDHYVTFTGPDELGRSRILRMSYYDSPKGAGWDISTGLVPHPSQPDRFLGEPTDPGDGERRCLGCHTTNFRAVEDRVGPESADHAMGCERCHGPGGHHVATVEGNFPDPAIIGPGRALEATVNRLCGQCHGFTESHGFTGEPDDPGWFRFQAARLEKSRCYSASGGRLHCVTCHDPHRTAETRAAPYEAKCLSCHGPDKTTCPVNPAKGCVECHMPRVWRQPTHSFLSDHRIRITTKGTPPGEARVPR
jgi:tetratricopeptide (TPR) repeat protein